MNNNDKKFTHTDDAKRRQSEAKKKWHAENRDHFRGDNHPVWGSEKSEEFKRNLSAKNSKAVRGFKMINMTTKEKAKVNYDEVLYRVSEGWSFVATRIHVNNGERNKLIKPETLEEFLDEGWIMGSIPQCNS